jgi:type I site-specific restriction endonuclease
MQSPEELAREKIDKLLTDCSWMIQNRSTINLSAGSGIAIREGLLKGGEADYLLFGDSKALGTVEAKPEGYTLVGVEEQSEKYGKGLLDIYPKWRDPLPFAYESTGAETRFTSRLDPSPTSRNVFAFHTLSLDVAKRSWAFLDSNKNPTHCLNGMNGRTVFVPNEDDEWRQILADAGEQPDTFPPPDEP